METKEVESKILGIVTEFYYPKAGDVFSEKGNSLTLQDLDMDSLDVTEFEIHLEETFGIDFLVADGTVNNSMTLGEVTTLIQRRL